MYHGHVGYDLTTDHWGGQLRQAGPACLVGVAKHGVSNVQRISYLTAGFYLDADPAVWDFKLIFWELESLRIAGIPVTI